MCQGVHHKHKEAFRKVAANLVLPVSHHLLIIDAAFGDVGVAFVVRLTGDSYTARGRCDLNVIFRDAPLQVSPDISISICGSRRLLRKQVPIHTAQAEGLG
jgi:hypothetical protein